MQASEREGFPNIPSGTVTFLFTDIEGSTKLLEQLREGYATILADQRDLLRAAFAGHNGHEIDTQGDAFFVAFSRALDAINCVIEAQQALAQHAWPAGLAVRVRMGLHTGEPILGRTGYVGMDVHRAARIAAAGHGGQVLLSQTTRDLIYQDLPSGAALRALGEFKLKDIRFAQPLYQLDIAGLPTEFAPLKTLSSGEEPPAPGEPPFKGLQYFDEPDADWFFGRDAVIGRLVTRACSERFLAVIGASGSGKSSLARAGLVPALKRGGSAAPCPDIAWQIFVLTPTAHPLEALATSLGRAAGSITATAGLIDDLRADPRSLHLYAQRQLRLDQRGARAASQTRMLLVVDQFEELFTLCRDVAERQAFVDNLLTGASADGGGASVLLTLRADFYEHLAAYPGLSAAVAQHQEYLGAMNAAELRQAIEAPAARGGWEFSPGLVDLLLHEIGASEGRPPEPGALPLLSHALLETWKHRRGNVMNLRAYSESGGVRGAIAHTAEGVFQQELNPAQQAIARNIFMRLTELGEGTQDTRRRVTYGELFPEAQGADVEEVLSRLADARLITTSEGTVEVAHEALIREWPTLRQWLDDDREGLRLHRHLTEAAQSWAAFNRDASELYRGTRLGQAGEWAATHPGQLNALEQEFLDASRAQTEHDETEREAARQRELQAARQLAEAQQQRAETQARAAQQLRRRAVYLLGALVVAVVAALAAVVFGQRASLSATAANQSLSTAQAAQATAQGEANARATQQSLAEANYTRAEAQRLAAESNKLALSSGSSELIALLALRSMKLEYSPQGDAALQAAAGMDFPLHDLAVEPAAQAGVFEVTYSPDGRYVATNTSGQKQVLSWWDTQTGSRIQTFEMPLNDGSAVLFSPRAAFSPDSRTIVICWVDPNNSAAGLVELHNVQTGQLIFQMPTGVCDARPVWLTPQSVLLGGLDKQVRVIDAATGREMSTWRTDNPVWYVFPNGQYAVEHSPDRSVTELWDLARGAAVMSSTTSIVWGAAVSPDGVYLALGFLDNTIKVWKLATGEVVTTLQGHTSAVAALDFSPDGQYLLSGSQDGTIQLWSVADWQTVRRWVAHPSGINAAQFSPNGRFLVTGGSDGVARVWNVQTQAEWPVLAGHTGIASSVAFSPDGRQLATVDDVVHLWDIHTGQITRVITSARGANLGVRFSPDGQSLLVGGWRGIVTLLDVATGTQKWQSRPAGMIQLNDLAFSPDGQSFAMSGQWTDPNQTYVIISDAHGGQETRRATITGTTTGYGVDYSPDGHYIVVATTDNNAWLLDAKTGEIVRKFAGHTGLLSGARFSPDGRYIVTGSADSTARLWDVATGQEIRRFVGHGDIIFTAAFSPDGKLIATASHDGTVRLWDVNSGQELRRYAADALAVENVAWSPDGKLLASVGDEGTAKLWDVDYHTTIAYLCGRLQRDLTDAERAQYNITDTTPTCGK